MSAGTRPLLLDLYCGAGGCTRGYQRAGFRVIGVDIRPQPNYVGDDFIEADALEVLRDLVEQSRFMLRQIVAIHASPPCQHRSTVTPTHARAGYVDLIPQTRDLLRATGRPYVIENVIGRGSPLIDPIRLCGSSFGLDVRRHRLFECSFPVMAPACDHGWQTPRFRSLDRRMVDAGRLASVVGVHGNLNYQGEFDLRCRAMGIGWMTNAELTQAIPPAYTEHIGGYLMAAVGAGDLEAAA